MKQFSREADWSQSQFTSARGMRLSAMAALFRTYGPRLSD